MRRPELKFEVEIDRQWWSGPTTLVNGKDRDIAGRKLKLHGGTWLDMTYVKGSYITAGEVRKGETGIETVVGDIIPSSFVDPSVLVNGKSIARPEYREAFTAYQGVLTAYQVELAIYEANLAAQNLPHELILGQETLMSQNIPQEVRQAA